MIRILDSFIADKIAAGEVIERPVSAVKELIENSIDAGASSVIVEIRGGGSSYIRITDDGSGIASEEIETAFLRHATSKISTASDLDNIQSLGFRGEALASISAVSRLTIVSRTSDEQSGTKLILHAGRVISKEKVGANTGTTIIVEDLFYNTPARRKFLKSDAREASSVIELVQQYAICYSYVRFMMINNGQTMFRTTGSGDTAAAVKVLYPDNSHSSLIPVSGDRIKGLISAPGTTVSSKRSQLFYVNGRLVSSKIIEKALTDGYGERIFSGFPVAILFIDVDPFEIDVNIHPTKREILFLHPDDISSRIKDAVAKALDREASVPRASAMALQHRESASYDKAEYSTDVADSSIIEATAEQSSIHEYLGQLEREKADEFAEDKREQNSDDFPNEKSSAMDLSEPDVNKVHDNIFSDMRFKGYIFDTYIITEAGDAVYVFDQHAAHERIFYERLLGVYNSSEKLSQPILSPIIVNVSADVYSLKDDILEALASFGYDIADFGGGSFIIREIPSYMSSKEAEDFANSFCNTDQLHGRLNESVVDKLIMKSCKQAVKGGDSLSEQEIYELISALSKCDNPYSCPHGRPTFIKITKYEAERAFKRK